MAIRSTSQYQAFRRRAGSAGSQGSYAASLVKRQASAEDDYWNNQYDTGNISAEQYLTILNSRKTTRTFYTPLQMQNLDQKITQVGEDFEESEVERLYKEGKIDTAGYTQYFKEKLNTLTPDNKKYNTLSIKVKGLEDKTQKESRAEYRRKQMIKISEQLGDTSKTLEQKAKLYGELEDQARLDGDLSQADQFLIQKNNAMESARKANITDYINETKGFATEEYGAANQSAPQSALGSQQVRSSGISTGATSGKTTGTTKTSAVSSFPTSASGSKAVVSAMKSINRLQTDRAELEYKIGRYESAINQATGDQKLALINSYNGLLNSYAQNETSLSDAQTRLDEAQKSAVLSNASKYATQTKAEIKKDQKDMIEAFRSGQLNKEEYFTAAKALSDRSVTFYDEVANGYDSLGEVEKADTYRTEFDEKVRPGIEDLEYKIANKNDFEPVRVDKNNKATNLFSDNVKAGSVELVDVSGLRQAGGFDENYAKIGNVYHRVYAPRVVDEDSNAYGGANENGEPVYLNFKDSKEYAKIADKLYVYGADGKAKKVTYAKTVDPKTKEKKTTFLLNEKQKNNDNTTMLERLKKTEKLTGAGVLTFDKTASGGAGEGVPIINTVNPKGKSSTSDKVFAFISKLSGGDKQEQKKNGPVDLDPTSATFLQPQKQKTVLDTLKLPTVGGLRSQKRSEGFSLVKPVMAAETEKPIPQPTIGAALSPEMEFQRLIIQELDKQGILNDKTLAYAMATAKHEASFQPKSEIMAPVGKNAHNDRIARLQNNYSGGKKYIGRGYIQLTHDYNYKEIGDAIGVDLVNKPELLLKPDIAAKAMAAFMKMRGVADLASKGDFVGARKPVNGSDKAVEIAETANSYLKKSGDAIRTYEAVRSAPASKPVKQPKAAITPTPKQGILGKTFDAVSRVIAPPVSGAELRSTKAPAQVRSTPAKANATSAKTGQAIQIRAIRQTVKQAPISTPAPKQMISTPAKANATSAKTGRPIVASQLKQSSTALPKASVAPTPKLAPKPAPRKGQPKQGIIQKVTNVISSLFKKR